jgi:molecular chaperone DnaK (HSP70)
LEQLVGMILKNIKLHANHQAGSDIKDAVLAIPPSWGWKSKMALINAASIADLSVLGLIN